MQDFKRLVTKIRELETILGSKSKIFSEEENNIKKVSRKSLVASKDIFKGHKLKRSDFVFKRPGTGISPMDLNKVYGRKLLRNIKKNRIIKFKDIL